MKTFQYFRPSSLDQLLALVEEHGPRGRLLAGGTDLVVRIRKRHDVPPVVVDLKHVTELSAQITVIPEGGIRIGARAVMTDVIEHPAVQRGFPALVEAARVVGSVQIRNRATVAGNICNASPAADTALPLLAYGAVVNLVSKYGRRHLPVERFFAGPAETTARPGEIVESIDVPHPGDHAGAAFGRLTRRHGVDLAIISVCCVARPSGEVRLALGAVGPRPLLVEDASGVLADENADGAQRRARIRDLLGAATPRSDLRGSVAYRSAMLAIVADRTLRRAIARMRD